jgi:hypothetical protein
MRESVFRIINTPLDQDWVRKISLFSVLIFFFSTGILFGQNQPSLLDLRTCGKSCSSGNYGIKSVFLSDVNGDPLQPNCLSSTPVTAYIAIIYETNSGASTSNARLFGDLVIGNTTTFLNYFLGNLNSAKNNDELVVLSQYPITWSCGQQVRILNPLISWTTSGSANLSASYDCNSYPSAQCQFSSDFQVNVPFNVDFDYEVCTSGGVTTVQLNSAIQGGIAPYTYSWEFGPNSVPSSPSSSTDPNPIITLLSTSTIMVTVRDAQNNFNFEVKTISTPNEISIVETITQPSSNLSNGSISLNLSGGTGTHTILWEDGSNSSARSNLSPGVYKATVTDAMGCSKSETYILAAQGPSISLIKEGVYIDQNGDGIQNVGDYQYLQNCWIHFN